MAHLQSARARPEPLALHHSNATQIGAPSSASDRARLLSSLRSAPMPASYAHQTQTYPNERGHRGQAFTNGNQTAFDPRTAAYNDFQNAQAAYLAELQRQILVKQNEIWLNQQQIEAEAALRAMSLQQQQLVNGHAERAREREWEIERARIATEREEAQARSNPLVASALARRKRQSLNLDAQSREGLAAPLRVDERSSGCVPPVQVRSRHDTPPSSSSPSSSSSVRSTPPPPALILSAPGEPYPDTSSSASGSDSGETRPSSPASNMDGSPRLDGPSDVDRELKANRRRSHLDTLSNALASRQKRRPVSMGGPPLSFSPSSSSSNSDSATTPRPGQLVFGSPASPHQPSRPSTQSNRFTPRATSDSHPSLRSPAFSSSSTFSPSHVTTSPRLSSSTSASTADHYVSHKPATLPGHAFAIRQPRGPPTTLGEDNFAKRIRSKVITDLAAKARRNRDVDVLAPVNATTGLVLDEAGSVHGGGPERERPVGIAC
ncbi:hypothetical protein JCM10212_004803 [Sporobolomyces blumeae]